MSLGLSKSLTALVWVAAPLCGVIVHPLAGALSDRIRTPLGRRRPFIIGGSIGVIISLLALAWVQEGFQVFFKSSAKIRTPVIVTAILWIYFLNVSIQPLQAGLRTLVIENCPAHQQTQASAMSSTMTGIGNVFGYLSGFSALPASLHLTKLTQFQCLCVIASISVMLTTALCCSIPEQTSPAAFPVRVEQTTMTTILKDLSHTYRSLPKRIRKVCHIQVFAWMGWFPFLFYSTT